MTGSRFMAWFVVAVSMASSTPGGSTPPPNWSGRACPPSPPLARWLAGTACRYVRHAGMWSRPWLLGGSRYPRRTWCSPSSCRARWRGGCANMPASVTPPSRRWWHKRWPSSCGGMPREAFGHMNGRALELECVFDRHAQADLQAAYAILVPPRRARMGAAQAEGGPPCDQRGDLRPGVVGPAGEGPDDRVADGGAARARRQAAS
jgi:hypothetical protein